MDWRVIPATGRAMRATALAVPFLVAACSPVPSLGPSTEPIVLASPVSGSPSPAAPETTSARFEEGPCQFRVPPSRTARCGYLEVPEDRARRSSRTIRLHVAIFSSDSPTPEPDPVVVLAGGPGGGALAEWPLQLGRLPFSRDREVVIFDQRGTGFSEPSLRCPESTTAMLDGLDGPPDAPAEALRLSVEAATRCRDRLLAVGTDPSAYTSAASASDLLDLRIALGYREWNLYGISYGTRLALTAVRDHPAGIRSVILDATYPPQVDRVAELAPNAVRAIERLFAACASEPACAGAYPNLRDRFVTLVRQLDIAPASFALFDPDSGRTLEVHADGAALVNTVFELQYDSTAIPGLPGAIRDLEQGGRELLVSGTRLTIDGWRSISLGMFFSVECGEEVAFSRAEDIDRSAADLEPGLARPFTEWADRLLATCGVWPASPRVPLEDEPVRSDVPTLLLAGDLDPITPPEWARLAAETLSRGRLFEFPGVGHGVLTARQCAYFVARDFLADPFAEPDATCLASMRVPAFTP